VQIATSLLGEGPIGAAAGAGVSVAQNLINSFAEAKEGALKQEKATADALSRAYSQAGDVAAKGSQQMQKMMEGMERMVEEFVRSLTHAAFGR
jgi:hypothetical protein